MVVVEPLMVSVYVVPDTVKVVPVYVKHAMVVGETV